MSKSMQWPKRLASLDCRASLCALSAPPTIHTQHFHTTTNKASSPRSPVIHHGERFTVKKSVFQGHAALIESVEDVQRIKSTLLAQKRISKATHHIFAYKIREQINTQSDMNPHSHWQVSDTNNNTKKKNRNSRRMPTTPQPEAPVSSRNFNATGSDVSKDRCVRGSDDDGEGGASAGLARLLDNMDVYDTVVFVTRWYGGVQLGPQRFRAINNAGKEALDILISVNASALK